MRYFIILAILSLCLLYQNVLPPKGTDRTSPQSIEDLALRQSEWNSLVMEHQGSHCLENFTQECLLAQTLNLMNYREGARRFTYLKFLAKITIKYGDTKSAKNLLHYWPNHEEIIAHENYWLNRDKSNSSKNMPPMGKRDTPESIANYFHIQYIQLLFLADEYEHATKELLALQKERKAGKDYGAISALVKRGDLKHALDISKLTLNWRREAPDPNENSSAIMHCRNYRTPATRPEGMSELAKAFIDKNELDKAYITATLIRTYAENNAYGQKSYCYMNFAKGAYFNTIESLIEKYIQGDDKSKANTLFDELITFFIEKTPKLKNHNWSMFPKIAEIAYRHELPDKLSKIYNYIEAYNEIEYHEINSTREYDPVSYIYALNGDTEAAIDKLEKFSIQEVKETGNPFTFEPAKPSDIKLTTYLKIVDTLVKSNKNEEALIYIEKLKPYIGKRQTKNRTEIDNIRDKIKLSELLYNMKEKEESLILLKEILDTQVKYAPFGMIATQYIKHVNIRDILSWSSQYPLYNGGNYSRIGKFLIDEQRFEELDIYFEEMAIALSTETNPMTNWNHVAYTLLNHDDYQRYINFINMADEIPNSALKRKTDRDIESKKKSIEYRKNQYGETSDTYEQIWLIKKLLGHALINQSVPKDTLEKAWKRYVKNCHSQAYYVPRYKYGSDAKPSAQETMAACYIGIVYEIDEYSRYQSRNKHN